MTKNSLTIHLVRSCYEVQKITGVSNDLSPKKHDKGGEEHS